MTNATRDDARVSHYRKVIGLVQASQRAYRDAKLAEGTDRYMAASMHYDTTDQLVRRAVAKALDLI